MQYRVIREIGRGGFGVVEEVEDGNGVKFARKRFSPGPAAPVDSYDQLRGRFRREVSVQIALAGGELMPILHHHLTGATPWFLMPLADKSYDRQIAEDKASGNVNIDALADILNGLQYLHDLDYVHRDLNPKNVLLHQGVWKLSDFGAVLPPNNNSIVLTKGTIIYTENYCAPEQKRDFHSAKTSADIYSFGCILHDIFGAGFRLPYGKQTADGDVGLIIEKCTEENPKKRPDVALLRSVLLDALNEIEIHKQPQSESTNAWLERLKNIDSWDDGEFNEFTRYLHQIDIFARGPDHIGSWISSQSTPLLTRIPAEALKSIARRKDNISSTIISRYCEWVDCSDFTFQFSDIICQRLAAIFDEGSPADKAKVLSSLIRLADSHNRWFVMRCAANRCCLPKIDQKLAKRFALELKTDGRENSFARCMKAINQERTDLPPDLAAICWQ